jgi:ribosomal RNA-processing protein 8
MSFLQKLAKRNAKTQAAKTKTSSDSTATNTKAQKRKASSTSPSQKQAHNNTNTTSKRKKKKQKKFKSSITEGDAKPATTTAPAAATVAADDDDDDVELFGTAPSNNTKSNTSSSSSSSSTAPNNNLSKLQQQMANKLEGAQFRMLNERLYTCEGKDGFDFFQANPCDFGIYHRGFAKQVQKWPVNPLDVFIADVKKRPGAVVGDFGCGEARLSASVTNKVRCNHALFC